MRARKCIRTIHHAASFGMLIAVMMILSGTPLDAQQRTPVAVGMRVRVWHGSPCCSSPQNGRLKLFVGDTVWLERSRTRTMLALPLSSVESVAIVDRRSNAILGGVVGLFAGGVAGFVMGSRNARPTETGGMSSTFGAIGGALGGLVAGIVIGSFVRSETTQPASMPAR